MRTKEYLPKNNTVLSWNAVKVDFHDTDTISCEQLLDMISTPRKKSSISDVASMKLSVGIFSDYPKWNRFKDSGSNVSHCESWNVREYHCRR